MTPAHHQIPVRQIPGWFSRIATRARLVTVAILAALVVQYATLTYVLQRVAVVIEEIANRDRDATEAVDALADSLGRVSTLMVGTAGGIYAAPGVAWNLPRISDTIVDGWQRVNERLRLHLDEQATAKAASAIAALPAFLAKSHAMFNRLPAYASAAQRKLVEELHDDWLDLRRPLQQFVEVARRHVDANGRKNLEEARSMDRRLSYFATAALALGLATLALTWYIFVFGIAHPTTRLVTAMRRIARGETDFDVPDIHRRGEVGDMARAVKLFRDNTIENRRLQKEAEESRRREDEELRRTAGLEREREYRKREIAESQRRLAQETCRVDELRRARDEADAANRAKSQFLANMSHELRTPLNAIIGFSDVIRGKQFGANALDRYVGYAASIHESGQHLLAMINDLIDLSKVEAGKLELDDAIVDPGAIANRCLALMDGQAREKGVWLNSEVGDQPMRLRADERAMRQVLLNLISNAVKFTPAGGKVTLRANRDGDGDLVLVVADTGIGIAAEDAARVFEAFERADAWHVRHTEGSGLGLTISRHLMELHGGALTLQSTLGSGTTVVMRFPADRVLQSQPLAATAL